MAMILVIGLVTGGMAFGTETDMGDPERRPGHRPPHPPKGPLGLLMKCQADNIHAEVLARITGQSAEALREAMKETHMRALLKTYGVDRETFRAAMDKKAAEQVQEAADDRRITQEQAADILDKIANPPDRDEAEPGSL
ncbi:MAG: hypothetical protein B6245_02585 [Desulfobacteraceae bacterium 4572_88]|nr:MAG: hypothetical protein B6245_02585 [Desulfobacteraceae bacterium 4572_88]RLC21590.1 MAG: hypothetical protein DRI57_01945 [Deltaproteobacteria bacterium]